MTDPERLNLLREKLKGDNYEKLMAMDSPGLHRFVADAVHLCGPESVFVCTDSDEDVRYVREQAVAAAEETPLAIQGHTVHYDGYYDQGRDKGSTKYLVPPGEDLGAFMNCLDRDVGLKEVRSLMRGSMAGREAIVRFFCLGPTGSEFSISGVQVTDSFYVAHSEDLLYRTGYEHFRKIGDSDDFFRVLHSSGRLERGISADADKRRVYIDIDQETVYSVNAQYAGNTVGFKKLSLRLAIRKADREGWLAEHMFVMGVHGPGDRVTYFTGAFPSFCGKTSTAMIPGETVIGDDLAYLRRIDGKIRAVNAESGIFGIIRNVTEKNDPLIWKVLTSPGEVIFSNVLVADGKPYWLGDGREAPARGVNHFGEWTPGVTDAEGQEVPLCHPNARYTIRLSDLENLDQCADDPAGVEVGGVIFGGRDSDTSVPVQQSFDWAHGVVTLGASLESETTAATIGKTGVRAFQPMSIQDFLSIYLGRYIWNYLEFGSGLERAPLIYGVNYFLRNSDGEYVSNMRDKYVWVKWMELRIHGEAGAVKSPTGYLPRYRDLVPLFNRVLDQDYPRERYVRQFTVRVLENLRRMERISEYYRTNVPDAPRILFTIVEEQAERLRQLRRTKGEYVSPFDLDDGW